MFTTAPLHAETITLDDLSATAIAEHESDGRPLVITGRCHVKREWVDGHRVLTLRLEADHWLFDEIDSTSDELLVEDMR